MACEHTPVQLASSTLQLHEACLSVTQWGWSVGCHPKQALRPAGCEGGSSLAGRHQPRCLRQAACLAWCLPSAVQHWLHHPACLMPAEEGLMDDGGSETRIFVILHSMVDGLIRKPCAAALQPRTFAFQMDQILSTF